MLLLAAAVVLVIVIVVVLEPFSPDAAAVMEDPAADSGGNGRYWESVQDPVDKARMVRDRAMLYWYL